LSGVLDHDAKRSRALEIVSYVPGVREVRSDMELSSGKGR
jgi:osmotically-inducible protein OsmY